MGAVGHAALGLLAACALGAAVSAQEAAVGGAAPADRDDHGIVFEMGAAGDWSRAEGAHAGGTIAFEVTPIEHWLEVEVGEAAIRVDGGAEIPVDVLFKKPWQLSRTAELMIGAGPELVHSTGTDRGTFWGLESVVDLMFWPRKNVGWYLEPGYELTRREGTSRHGAEISGGLLIGR